MREPIKTFIVTDVPFWESLTGAQARITQLVENLSEPPFDVTVILTQTGDQFDFDQVAEKIPSALQKIDLSHPPKHGLWPRLKWFLASLAHAMGIRPRAWTPSFNQYYPPAIADRFVDLIVDQKPDVVIFEYATQIQLLRAIPAAIRNKLVAVVDTHDILWKRAQQFLESGQQHWIDVSQPEEERAIKEFDLVIAIQEYEGEYFSQVSGSEKVAVTSMEFELPSPVKQFGISADSEKLSIGLMASNNWANLDTAQQILDCWQELSHADLNVELVFAGSICASAQLKPQLTNLINCRVLGLVDSVDEFYRSIDLVWNPVRYGTGLKIKNLEALAYAKCLITSSHGAEGLVLAENTGPSEGEPPIMVLNSTEELVNFLQSQSRSDLEQLALRGRKHLEKWFGPGTQYPALRQKIESLYAQKLT